MGRRGIQLAVGGLALVAVIAAGLLGWRAYTAHQEQARTETVAASVKVWMQNGFNNDIDWMGYSVTVRDVSLVHKSGNEYVGFATVSSYKLPSERRIAISVVNDGSPNQVIKIEPADRVSLAHALAQAS